MFSSFSAVFSSEFFFSTGSFSKGFIMKQCFGKLSKSKGTILFLLDKFPFSQRRATIERMDFCGVFSVLSAASDKKSVFRISGRRDSRTSFGPHSIKRFIPESFIFFIVSQKFTGFKICSERYSAKSAASVF